MFVWVLLMASQKHHKALLGVLNGKEVPIETTPLNFLSLMGVEGSSHPFLAFSDEDLPPKELLTLNRCKSPLNA